MLFSVVAMMGKGKTLFATLWVVWRFLTEQWYSIANYNIKNIPGFVYSPAMFFPVSELQKKTVIVADDCYALENAKGLLGVLVNMSRKKTLDVVLTAQYYTFIPKPIRELSFIVFVKYFRHKDVLKIRIYTPDLMFRIAKIKVINAVKKAEQYYDTNEVVEYLTEKRLMREVKKFSRTEEDMDVNLMMLTKSITRRKQYQKIIESLPEVEN